MKKNKIIGIGVSILGLASSMAVAFALYSQLPANVGMNIGPGSIDVVTTSDKLVYKAGSAQVTYAENFDGVGGAAQNVGTHYDAAHTQIQVMLPLSATYPTVEGVIAQASALGKLSLTVTPNAALSNNVSFQMAAYVNGYEEGNYFATASTVRFTQPSADAVFNKSNAFNASIHVPVKTSADGTTLTTANSNYLRVWMNVTGMTAEDALNANEKLFDISVAWGAPDTDYEMAYIVGYQTNWKTYSEYRMVPSLDATDSSYTWKFSGLGAGEVKALKVATEDLVEGKATADYAGGKLSWATGSNLALEGTNNTVKWQEGGATTLG